MFVRVLLLNGAPRPFTYEVPVSLQEGCSIGCLVQVPLQRRFEWAMVAWCGTQLPPEEAGFKLRPLESIIRPADHVHTAFIHTLARYYALEPHTLYKRLRSFLRVERTEQPPISLPSSPAVLSPLTDEQHRAYEHISQAHTDQGVPRPLLLQGVTGSGKTEVYLHAAHDVIRRGGRVLVLVPEVSLALSLYQRWAHALGAHQVMSFHSGTTRAEKQRVWQAVLDRTPGVIIGVHMPLLLPHERIDLIIVDEEHEIHFQEHQHPRINTKEAALLAAAQYGCPIVLGSATPSLSSLYQVQRGAWTTCYLTQRYRGAFPAIQKVCLRTKDKRPCFWLSRPLEQAITTALEKKEQVLLFLNRRGYSFFMQCTACGSIPQCTACSVSLTVHEHDMMRCHYCGYSTTLPSHCSACSHTDFLKKGIGTQQLMHLVQQRFPEARIARADLDSTSQKKKWLEVSDQFSKGALDILVGTQTITKGLHFPNVTVVGVIWADCNLSMPVYHASEGAVQQLIQVAGRAGRERPESTVIVQYMNEHPALRYLHEESYYDFCQEELEHRALLAYPPVARLVELEFSHPDADVVEREAQAAAHLLSTHTDLTVRGPVPPLVEKRQHMHYRLVYLKASQYRVLQEAYARVRAQRYTARVWYTPNPL